MAGRFRGVAIPLIIVCALVGAYATYRYVLHRKVAAALDGIRAAGFPASIDELDAWYDEVPDGENAAELYRAAFALPGFSKGEWGKSPAGKVTLPEATEPLTEEQRVSFARCLEANEEALQVLHEAAARERCRYPITIQLFALDTAHLQPVQRASHLLQMQAIMRADANDGDVAVSAVLDGLALGRSLDNEPLLISQLVRELCYRLATQSLEHVLNRTALTSDQLARFDTVFRSAEAPRGLLRGLAGERCLVLASIEQHPFALSVGRAGGPAGVLGGLLDWFEFQGAFLIGRSDFEALHFAEVAGQLINALQGPLPAAWDTCQAIAGGETADTSAMKRRVGGVLGGFTRAGESLCAHTARIRLAQTALALERYRLAKGKCPDTLAALVPDYIVAVPQDPFDGAPLRYRITSSGYVVYSVYIDRQDDGGVRARPGESKNVSPVADLTFTVERQSGSDSVLFEP